MIPKIIHYCWFGRGKKLKLAERCIASWRKFLPDYEIKEWNEDNFDVNSIPYTAEAYAAKKYAFVSDYARFAILYQHGGIYFDTDVEIIRPMDDILAAGPFMGLEQDPIVTENHEVRIALAPGLGFAFASRNDICHDILEMYRMLHFKNPDGSLNLTTVVKCVTDLMLASGFIPRPGIVEFKGIKIYPSEYFNPKRPNGRIVLTKNTRTIHHYSASWHSPRQRIVDFVVRHLGKRAGQVVSLLMHNPFYIVRRVRRYRELGK